MVKLKPLAILSILSLLPSASPVAGSPDETRTFVAYSMNAAQKRVERALRSGEDFRNKWPDLYYLGNITKPWAVVIDNDANDWILVGEHDSSGTPLSLDDWIVALRARFFQTQNEPGVTIDPLCCEECLKEHLPHCTHAKEQRVRFFGGIENTHFGQVCFAADWLTSKMHELGLDLENS
jgi:hypothetical protein